VQKVEAAYRHAGEVHPNHPSIVLIRTNTDKIASTSDHPDKEVRPSCLDLSFDGITYHQRLFFVPKLQLRN
jgi:hypothetical protein